MSLDFRQADWSWVLRSELLNPPFLLADSSAAWLSLFPCHASRLAFKVVIQEGKKATLLHCRPGDVAVRPISLTPWLQKMVRCHALSCWSFFFFHSKWDPLPETQEPPAPGKTTIEVQVEWVSSGSGWTNFPLLWTINLVNHASSLLTVISYSA